MARKRKRCEDKFVNSAQPGVPESNPCVTQSADEAAAHNERHGHWRQKSRSDPKKDFHPVDDSSERLARQSIDTAEDDVLPPTKTKRRLSEQRKLTRKLKKKEKRRRKKSATARAPDSLSADWPQNENVTNCPTTDHLALETTMALHSVPSKIPPPPPPAPSPPRSVHAVQSHQGFSDRYGLQQARQLARMAARRAQSNSGSSTITRHDDTSVSAGAMKSPHRASIADAASEVVISIDRPHEVLPHTELSFALSDEQKQLVDLIGKGNNVFYTGSAGTGKSTVLRAFVADLERQGKVVVKVAPTGVAALNIGGQTYFKFAGWAKNSQKRSLQFLEHGARTQHKRWKRLNEADVLVIDEVSMMDAHQLDRLDYVCRAAREPAEELWVW